MDYCRPTHRKFLGNTHYETVYPMATPPIDPTCGCPAHVPPETERRTSSWRSKTKHSGEPNRDGELIRQVFEIWNLPAIEPAIGPARIYCTNSSVICHKAVRSEEFVFLSRVTSPFEDSDKWFSGLWGLKSIPKRQFWRDFHLVTPTDGGRRVAFLFVAVTGHKPRRFGRNGTVWWGGPVYQYINIRL